MIQKSFVMMKPDAVQRRLMGKILSRFEEKGLQIVAVKLMQIDEELAKTHYGEHAEKPFFPGLVEYITSSPALAMVIEGEEAITTIRKLVGATNPLEADLGTIRGDYGMRSLRTMPGGGSALSCCAFTHRVAFEEGRSEEHTLNSSHTLASRMPSSA